jgi:hypothetical protein
MGSRRGARGRSEPTPLRRDGVRDPRARTAGDDALAAPTDRSGGAGRSTDPGNVSVLPCAAPSRHQRGVRRLPPVRETEEPTHARGVPGARSRSGRARPGGDPCTSSRGGPPPPGDARRLRHVATDPLSALPRAAEAPFARRLCLSQLRPRGPVPREPRGGNDRYRRRDGPASEPRGAAGRPRRGQQRNPDRSSRFPSPRGRPGSGPTFTVPRGTVPRLRGGDPSHAPGGAPPEGRRRRIPWTRDLPVLGPTPHRGGLALAAGGPGLTPGVRRALGSRRG